MQYIATLEAIHSRRDTYGNCYWAFRYTCHETGKTIVGTISGGESNINAIRYGWLGADGWNPHIMARTTELPIREFNRLVKGWEYAGCSPDSLKSFITFRLTKGA